MDYRKRRAEQAPINIDGAVVERVEIFKFLGSIMVQTHQREESTTMPIPLRRLKIFGMGTQILQKF